jgi:hypothetical protein
MKNLRKNEPALSDRLLELRFAERNLGLWVLFRHEVPIFAGYQAVSPLSTVGFRGEILLGLASPTAC